MKQTLSWIFGMCCLLLVNQLEAQTPVLTGSIVQQPCNNNGVLSVSVTNMPLPVTYNYSFNGQSITHNSVNSLSDVLSGIGAHANPGNADYVYVYITSGNTFVSQTFTMTLPFNYSVSVTPAICPAMGTVNVSNITGGTGPFTYNLTNQINMLSYTGNPAAVSDGRYTLDVTDALGCVVTVDTSLYVQSSTTMTLNVNTTAANCTNGTASVSVGNGAPPYSYLWSNGASSSSITGLTGGSYGCKVTDAQGCTAVAYAYVQQAVNITFNTTVTDATCIQSNGSIMGFAGGGTAPYTYAWSNGANTANISGLAGNQNYNALVTDAHGCLGNGSGYVNASTPITVTYATSPSACISPTGSASLTPTGGAAPYNVVWNTLPVATGTLISNMPAGDYGFHVTDANGCVQSGVAHIPFVSIISANISGGAAICPATHSNLYTNVAGSNPPFSYAWNTGSTASSLSNMPLGSYNCTITDALGCSVMKYGNVWQASPVNVGLSSAQASCLFTADGTATATGSGGTSPYAYHWSNGATGATASGLLTGNYYVTVTDANGCSNNNSYANHVYVGYNAANSACYCTISGMVYNDANSNCTMDAGETPIQNVMVHCSGMGYTFSDANGVYSFLVPTGSYTLSESVQPNYPLSSCQSNSVAVSITAATGCTNTVNFANGLIPVHDLHIISSSLNQPIPGNAYVQQLIVQNEGTVTENNVQLGYTHDGQLAFNGASPIGFVQQNAAMYPDWYSVTSGFPSLVPGQSTATIVNYNVPTNIPLNTLINFYDTVAHAAPIVSTWLTDNTPWNNVNQYQAVVIGSYDPNFKEVSPKGTGPQGYINPSDSVLNYVIHFQNTGSFYAENVVLADSLDPHLDLATLRPGYVDHAYTTSVTENGVIKFTFRDIHLPWKNAYGDAMSSGMITYSVKLKRNIPEGTQIKNKAAIYFDYNEPVITNTTLNTMSGPLSVNDTKAINNDNVILYPNPASGAYALVLQAREKASCLMTVTDIEGRTMLSKTLSIQSGTNVISENATHLENGIYFIQLRSENSLVTKKLVVTK